jgi:oxygen-dependent protoporphyrinogen oxidase
MDRTVIVGGGISGLSLGFWLAQKGRDVRVLEASARAGGSVRTVAQDGFLFETGPHGFLDAEPAMQRLVDALGLTSELRPADDAAKRRWLFSEGALQAVPSSPPAFLRSRLLPWSAKLRVLAEPLSRRGRSEDESLADFARRHLGARATALLVDAVQSGIYAGDPERLSAQATFPKLVAMERAHRSLVLAMVRQKRAGAPPPPGTRRLTSFHRGLSTLTDALGERLGTRLVLDARAERVERTPQGFRVTVSSPGRASGEQTFEAEQLVLATPARLAGPLLAPLSAPLAEALKGLTDAPLSVVHLCYREDTLSRPLDGFGFLIPSVEGRRILGAIFVSQIFPERAKEGHAQLAVMVGGAKHRDTAALDPAQLSAVAHDEVAAILGTRGAPTLTRVTQWPHAIPQYEVGHLARVAKLDALVAGIPGLHLTGSAYRGVGLNDCVRSSNELSERL